MSLLTTTKVARICVVAPRTVAKWVDTGRLKGRRIIGSQDRRIDEDDLAEFLVGHSMPFGALIDVVTYVGNDSELADELSKRFAKRGKQVVSVEPQNTFDLGARLIPQPIMVLVLDLKGYGVNFFKPVLSRLRAEPTWQGIVLLPGKDEQKDLAGLEVFPRPFDPKLLYERMCTLIGW